MAKFLQRSRSNVLHTLKREFMKHPVPCAVTLHGFRVGPAGAKYPPVIDVGRSAEYHLDRESPDQSLGLCDGSRHQGTQSDLWTSLTQLNVTGAYAYLSDDIGFDLNGLKDPLGGVVNSMSSLLPPPVLMQASD